MIDQNFHSNHFLEIAKYRVVDNVISAIQETFCTEANKKKYSGKEVYYTEKAILSSSWFLKIKINYLEQKLR